LEQLSNKDHTVAPIGKAMGVSIVTARSKSVDSVCKGEYDSILGT